MKIRFHATETVSYQQTIEVPTEVGLTLLKRFEEEQDVEDIVDTYINRHDVYCSRGFEVDDLCEEE